MLSSVPFMAPGGASTVRTDGPAACIGMILALLQQHCDPALGTVMFVLIDNLLVMSLRSANMLLSLH
jgi:hypothetical protein